MDVNLLTFSTVMVANTAMGTNTINMRLWQYTKLIIKILFGLVIYISTTQTSQAQFITCGSDATDSNPDAGVGRIFRINKTTFACSDISAGLGTFDGVFGNSNLLRIGLFTNGGTTIELEHNNLITNGTFPGFTQNGANDWYTATTSTANQFTSIISFEFQGVAQRFTLTKAAGTDTLSNFTAIRLTPLINSSAAVSVFENQTAAIDVNATDDNDSEGGGLTYSITGGADAAMFSIVPTTGVLTFNTAPDFESANDDDSDNVYNVEVTVTDNGGTFVNTLSDVQNIAVTVLDVTEIAVTSSESGSVADGGTDAQGSEPAGTAKTVTYTVNNTGLADLTLVTATSSNLTNVTIDSISAPAATTVAPGGSTSFTVEYTPTIAGAFSFDISFTNNDSNVNPYDITLSGTASGDPEIAVTSSESGSVADGGTDAQGSEPAGTAKTVTYTVNNTGLADLTLVTATSSNLTNVTIDSISAPAATTVAPGGSTSFTVEYTPTIAGAFSFDISFTNNDSNEDPYDITLSGTASGDPEIAVTSSESGSVADGGTDAQGSEPAGTAKTVTYTVNNTGLADLTLVTATSSNLTNVTIDSISAPAATTVAPGGSTSFTVEYTPTIAGAFSFDISFTNNDSNEDPYDITLSGTASGDPEIAVTSSESGSVADGGTDAQGSEPAGTAKTVTYTVNNTGLADLTLVTATSSNLTNVTIDSISAPAATTVAPGGSTSFTVEYTPTIAGAFSFDISFTNNDGNEDPYDITLSGTASGDPEIAVTSSESGSVADGGTDAQGSEPAGTAKTVTYTVNNTGLADLTLVTATSSNLTNVTIDSISAPAATTVAPGGSTSFTVEYTPTIAGAFSFDISFTNNDSNEDPYDITLSGTASGDPEIAVTSSESGSVADGGTDAQGSEPAGTAKTVTYTVNNTGLADLTLVTATSSNLTNVTIDSISAPAATTVAPGGSTSFTVEYTPTIAGAFSFDISFTNNDGNEDPYDITLSGTASGDPEIAVTSSESGSVADGGTDAQGSEPAGTAKTVTYTVNNTGLADLTLVTATSSNLTNVTIDSISAPAATTVAPGGSTSFTVEYTPTIAGAFSFDISFTNNDSNVNPYDITLSGTASGDPEIAVTSSESGSVADGGTDAQGSEPAGTAKTVTYTVNNTGLADLTLVTATSSNLTNVTIDSISAPAATTVAPGGSTSFTVEYTPTIAGAFSFDISFTNNDGNEDPYDITLSGTASGDPEIAVTSSESGSVADGGTDAQGSEPAGTAKTVTYTVNNTGLADLTLVTATSSSLTNVTIDSISAPAATTVAPGGSTSFTVEYTPTIAGAFSFDISFTNNDGNEDPYDITLSGTASGDPEIAVTSSESGSVADGGTDAQGSEPAGTAKTVTYTVNNTGLADLTLVTATSSSLTNVTIDSISAPAATTVAPGGSTSFTVEYTPTIAGAFSFDISFTNNDSNEDPYDITLSGTASGDPEIAVTSSESGSVADGGTDAQGSEPAGTAKTVTYTVNNTGLADLTLVTATSSNLTNVTIDSISAPAATTVAPGGSTSFTVEYTPTIAGAFSFDISFTNNDGNEDPYDITLSGTASGDPEIAVTSSESGSVADGGTDAQGSEPAGTAKTVTYTVNNTGLADLTLVTATSSNLTNVTIDSISAPAATTVAPGGSTSFTVEYTPTIAGAFSFDISFTNNDGNEDPYDITLSGTASGDPEIAVTSSESGSVADGGTDAQGSEPAGTAKTVTYTVNNTGLADLTLVTATSSNLTNVTIDSISAPAATTVAPGGSTSFTVEYTPTIAGAFSFDISFTNNDGNEDPYDITLSGTASGDPEIAVTSSESGSVADGGTDAQGSEPAGTAKTVTYTVNNTGLADLTLVTATSSNLTNVTIDSISAPAATTVAPGGSTSFTVEYTPTIAGAFSFDISFTNNDGNEDPYDITLSGTASGDPEIAVTSSESGSVADGGTDAQGSEPAGTAKTVTYTVNNTGLADLTLVTATSSNLTNVTIDSISAPAATTVAPGGSTSFTVEYTPTIAGAFSFDISFTNNDGNEDPYDITLSGTASGDPEIAVTGNGVEIVDGDTSTSNANFTYFGPADFTTDTVARTFVIQNTGLGFLNLGAGSASLSGAGASEFVITTQPAAVVAPGGSTNIVVTFDPTSIGSKIATLSIANNDADESPYDFTIGGEGTGTGSITIVQNITGPDTTVSFSSPATPLNFALTTVNGTAQRDIADLAPDTYSIAAADLSGSGYAVSGVSCDDNNSTTDISTRTASIDLSANEHVICVFELLETREHTSKMIADYLGARNRLLLAHQPDRVRRLHKLRRGQESENYQAGLVSAYGASVDTLLPLNATLTENTFSFDASLRQLVGTGKGSDELASAFVANSRWDIWVEGHIARFEDDSRQDGRFGVVYGGIDYQVNPDLLVGIMGQYDWLTQSYENSPIGVSVGTNTAAKVDGSGWMVGPYLSTRITDSLYFDGRATWGRSNNKISPFGTYEDEFDTERWLVSATLIGEYKLPTVDNNYWTIRPGLTFQYIEENQFSYTDSLDVTIPEQTIAQGDIRIGPRISYTHQLEDGAAFNPWVELNAVYGFTNEGEFSRNSYASSSDGFSGSIQAGIDIFENNGVNLTLSGQYDGIGSSEESYGGTLKFKVPLN